MKQYKCIRVNFTKKATEDYLNELAEIGWEVICSYSYGDFLILERKKKK